MIQNAGLSAVAQPAARQVGPANQAEPAAMDAFGPALAEIIKTSLVQDHLQFEFPQMAEVNELLNRHGKYFRGGGSGQSGGRFWYSVRNGPPLRFEISSGDRLNFQQVVDDRFSFDIEQSEPHDRWVSFLNRDGISRIQVVDISQQKLLQFVSRGKSQTVIRWVNGEQAGAMVASSLVEATLRNGEVLQGQVIPLLEQAGIKLPAMALQNELFAVALECLDYDDTTRQRLQPLLDSLNAANFEERESATQELSSQFSNWRVGIILALLDDKVTGEVRSRLRKVLDEKQTEPSGKTAADFLNQNCWKDPAFWLELLNRTTEPERRTRIASQLQQLTGLDFASDAAKAQAELAQRAVVATEPPKPAEPAQPTPQTLDKLHEPMADLLPLTIIEGRLALDREHWKQRFGNQKVTEILEKAQTLIRESHLPPRWLNLGNGFNVALMEHSHLLFEHLESAALSQLDAQQKMMIPMVHSGGGVARDERDRRLEVGEIKASLLYFRNQGDLPPEQQQTLQLRIEERHPMGMQVAVDQHHSGRFWLNVVGREAQQQLVVWQAETGAVVLHWFDGDQHRVIRADQFAALQAEHRTWLTEVVWPFLAKHHLHLSESLQK